MLTVYRRHRAGCKHVSRRYKGCFCPLWVQGTLRGEKMRKSLDLTNWEAAHKLVREWEVHSPAETVTVDQAGKRFIADNEARNMTDRMQRKYKTVIGELNEKFKELPIRNLTVHDVRQVRAGWKLAPITEQKRIEMMRCFFRFCIDSGWMEKNPAKKVKVSLPTFNPTLPFTEEEMKKILWAADTIEEIHPKMRKGVAREMKALILLMRYSGIRISDAVNMKRERITEGKLFLYQQKTKQPVYVPLPKVVLDALEELDGEPFYFYTGAGSLKTCVTDWQSKLRKVFAIAGIADGHAHRFRDSFAVSLLLKGVSIQTVSVLLGHQNIAVTQRHYNPWIKERQDALEAAVMQTWA
jgi:integrase/recombinase XerD